MYNSIRRISFMYISGIGDLGATYVVYSDLKNSSRSKKILQLYTWVITKTVHR